MRKALSLTAALAAVSVSHAVDPVYSDPVGFVKLGNTAADGATIPAVPANTDVRIAIPLEQEIAFSGVVDSTSANSITIANNPGFTANAWAPADATPFTAIIGGSGSESGLRALITANTADTLTVSVTTPGDLTQVAQGEPVLIRPCWTLSTFFADSALTDNCQVLLWEPTDTLINQAAKNTYIYFGGDWYDNLTFDPANHVILYPGESFRLRSDATPISTLTVFGDVPTTPLRNELVRDGAGTEDLHLANMSPVPVPLASLSIPAADNDLMILYNNAAAGINKDKQQAMIFFGGRWYDDISFADVTDSITIFPGTGFNYRRADTAPASEEWTEPAP